MKLGTMILARWKPVAAIAFAAGLSGCATTPPFGGAPGLAVEAGTELPVPGRVDAIGDYRPYLVGPFDRLTIGVFGIDDLAEREVQVDSSGRVSFPLAGSIEAAGMTLSEIEAVLSERLSAAYVRDPQVTVNLKETINRVVTVDGQVAKPGSFPVVGKMSLLRAVALRASTTEFAKLEDVVVFREVAGQRYAGIYNLEAIRRGNYPDPEIFANDVIVVGDSPQRRMFRDFLQLAPLLSSPLILLLQNS